MVVKLVQLFVTKSGVLSCVGHNIYQNTTATSVLLRNTFGCHTRTFTFDHAALADFKSSYDGVWTEFLSVTFELSSVTWLHKQNVLLDKCAIRVEI